MLRRTLNLGILAHVDAGKTTLTERLLYAAGVIDEIGSVDDGTTQTDSLELERVGLGGAGVDAADVVDGAGGEEESLGEGGLTGVDVGEDSETERAHGTSCLPRR